MFQEGAVSSDGKAAATLRPSTADSYMHTAALGNVSGGCSVVGRQGGCHPATIDRGLIHAYCGFGECFRRVQCRRTARRLPPCDHRPRTHTCILRLWGMFQEGAVSSDGKAAATL